MKPSLDQTVLGTTAWQMEDWPLKILPGCLGESSILGEGMEQGPQLTSSSQPLKNPRWTLLVHPCPKPPALALYQVPLALGDTCPPRDPSLVPHQAKSHMGLETSVQSLLLQRG